MMNKILRKIVTPSLVGKFLNYLAIIAPKRTGSIAFGLFCTPREGRLFNANEKEFINTSAKKTIQFENSSIQSYHWKGEKETILLVHGWESNSARWKDLITLLLEKNYNVIAFDAPAHGNSEGKTITAIMYSKVIQKVAQIYNPEYIIGHSFGGMASAYFLSKEMLEKPIKKFICLGTPSNLDTLTDLFYNILSLSPRAKDCLQQYFVNNLGFSISSFAVHDFIKNIKIPGLVMHDEKDEIISYKEAFLIQENWKNSSLFLTKNLGHSMQSLEVYRKILLALAPA